MSNQNIATPWNFFRAVEKWWDIEFEHDMAAGPENAKCDKYFTEDDDALSIDWPKDGWCWLNPPFAGLTKWVEKCRIESRAGSNIVSIWPLSGDINTIPCWKYADTIIVVHGRVWPNVRSCMVCRWLPYILGRQVIMGMRWNKKTGELTKEWNR